MAMRGDFKKRSDLMMNMPADQIVPRHLLDHLHEQRRS
jgi:hypothetical protein